MIDVLSATIQRRDSEASEAADMVRLAVVRWYANAEDGGDAAISSSSLLNMADKNTPDVIKKIPWLRFVLSPQTPRLPNGVLTPQGQSLSAGT